MPRKVWGVIYSTSLQNSLLLSKTDYVHENCPCALYVNVIYYVCHGVKKIEKQKKNPTLSINSNKTNNKISCNSKGSLKKIKIGLLSISMCDKFICVISLYLFYAKSKIFSMLHLSKKKKRRRGEFCIISLEVTC